MNKPFLYVLIATLGLAGCGGGGGGGGGGGSDGGSSSGDGGGGGSDDSGEFTTISRQDLVGNWIRTETTYDTDAQDERSTWSATSHETVSITLQGNALNHRDCVTDVNKNATFSNKELSVGTTTFTVVDKNTMTYSTEATEIEYRRMQESDYAVAGLTVSFSPPPFPLFSSVSRSEWVELCASSELLASGIPTVEFKGVTSMSILSDVIEVVLRMNFEGYGSSPFASDTYVFPSTALLDVGGEFAAYYASNPSNVEYAGILDSPSSGSVNISSAAGGRSSFLLTDLKMMLDDGTTATVKGTLGLPSAWLEKPEL